MHDCLILNRHVENKKIPLNFVDLKNIMKIYWIIHTKIHWPHESRKKLNAINFQFYVHDLFCKSIIYFKIILQ